MTVYYAGTTALGDRTGTKPAGLLQFKLVEGPASEKEIGVAAQKAGEKNGCPLYTLKLHDGGLVPGDWTLKDGMFVQI
jgi:hypothetical protein